MKNLIFLGVVSGLLVSCSSRLPIQSKLIQGEWQTSLELREWYQDCGMKYTTVYVNGESKGTHVYRCDTETRQVDIVSESGLVMIVSLLFGLKFRLIGIWTEIATSADTPTLN